MFLATLGYRGDKVLRTLHKSTDECDTVEKDKRGKHSPPHKVSEADGLLLKNHILKFNPNISHYRREHAQNRLYLPTELDIAEMYEDYKLHVEEAGRKCLSYVTYWREVKSMNISFAKLGVEECEVCDQYKIHKAEKKITGGDAAAEVVRKKSRKQKEKENEKSTSSTNTDKNEICAGTCDICSEYAKHVEAKTISLEGYKADTLKAKVDKETIYLSCDLQKVILLPRIPGYKTCLFTSRLIAFNQTFAPIGRRGKEHNLKPVGVLWHESIAGRKDENIASAYKRIFSYMKFRDYKNWVIWADNCGGQNK